MDEKQLHKAIIDWHQSGQNFKKGVKLFKLFHKNKVLHRRFDKLGNIPFNKALLTEKLIEHARFLEKQGVLKTKKKQEKPVTKTTKTKKKDPADNKAKQETTDKKEPVKPKKEEGQQVKPGTVDFETKPKEVRALELEKVKLYVEANIIFNKQLLQAKTDEQRAVHAETIVEKMHENQRIWDKIHVYNKTGKLPKEDTPPAPAVKDKEKLTPLQMQRKLTNRRSNISRYKNLIAKNPNNPKNENYHAKIKEWEEEVKFYQDKLK